MTITKRIFSGIAGMVCAALVLACAGGGKITNFSELEGRVWKLSDVKGAAGTVHLDRVLLEVAGQGGFFTIEFRGDQYNGRAAPNLYRGPYKAGANQALALEPPAGTLMAAFVNIEGLSEDEYFSYLAQTSRWSAGAGVLELYSAAADGSAVTLVFASGDSN
jgi:hypothetical protein